MVANSRMQVPPTLLSHLACLPRRVLPYGHQHPIGWVGGIGLELADVGLLETLIAEIADLRRNPLTCLPDHAIRVAPVRVFELSTGT